MTSEMTEQPRGLHDLKDISYMSEAITLASLARGHTSPNPVVGAVIVQDGDGLQHDPPRRLAAQRYKPRFRPRWQSGPGPHEVLDRTGPGVRNTSQPDKIIK